MIRQKPEPKKKAQPAPVDAGDLKRFADRIDNLEEERVAIVGDIKDVFTEVKSKGYNAKALRKVLADRRKKTDEELEADMEMYRAALAEPGATYRSVAERHGIPKTNLHRLVPKSTRGTGGGQPDSDLGAAAGDETVAPATPAPKPEDGDDGITVPSGGPVAVTNGGGDHDVGHLDDSRRHQSSEDSTDESLAAGVAAQTVGGDDDRRRLNAEPGVARVVPPASCADEAGIPVSVGAVADDDLTIPSFLDRRTPAQGRAG